MEVIHVNLEGSDVSPLQTLLQLVLGEGLRGGVDLLIDTLLDHRLFDDVTTEVEIGNTLVVNVIGDFLVGGDRGVVILQRVVVIVTDSLGQTVVDGGDQFVTSNQVDSTEGRTEVGEGSEVRLVEGGEGNSGEEIVVRHRTGEVGVGQTDETGTRLEGGFNLIGENGGDGQIHRLGRCHG